jgi:hypothetical protein
MIILEIAAGVVVILVILATGIVLFVAWWTDPHQVRERAHHERLRRNWKQRSDVER